MSAGPTEAEAASLSDAAVRVLAANDVGGWTRPAPRLYPHQWSWDSAFIAIGLAHLEPDRALRELESLFLGQWADGRVPQIVYNAAVPADAYFPDAQRWACAELSPNAPTRPRTSGICQPPVHALAALRILELAPDADAILPRLRALYPKLLTWHRYLATARDPDGSGLVTIYHPWESGTDNSPRWDGPLADVVVGSVPPYVRRDLQHVADPSERPTDAEYDRYLWLVESLKAARYDDAAVHRTHPFLVKDVVFSAVFAAANDALDRLADRLGVPDEERARITDWRDRASAAVIRTWDPGDELAFDLDVRTGRPIRVRTWAGLAPLFGPRLDGELAAALARKLSGPDFAGAVGMCGRVVPSTSPASADFRPRTYWRGPVWPIANWLLWWGLRRHGRAEALALRQANLRVLARSGAELAEYFEPFSGEALGSHHQSWTAAVALDWLATAN